MSEHKLHPFLPADVERVVLQAIVARRDRARLFAPELFSDPAWDLLLVLFLARLRRHRLAILQLAEEACLSAATTSRWLDALKQHGLIAHCPDPRAGGRDFIELSARGAAGMQQWVQDCIERQADARSDDRVIDLLTRMQGDRR